METKFEKGDVVATKRRVHVLTGVKMGANEVTDPKTGVTEEVPFVLYQTGDGHDVSEKDILGTIEVNGPTTAGRS